jgi:uncharacterized membrane protein YfcA
MLIEPWYIASLLLAAFFISAILHSSVGLGGGSSYTAWMVILAVPSLMIPSIALSLNVLVSSLVCIQFTRKDLMPWKILGLVLLFSLPTAYIGGSMQVDAMVIHSLLLASLIFIVFRLIYFDPQNYQQQKIAMSAAYLSIAALGAVLGFLAGLVGIGGGIYLVPALLLLRLAGIKQAAACGGGFILCNSVVGLLAKWQTQTIPFTFEELAPYLVAVAIGGILGSQFSISQKNQLILQRLLLWVVIIACLLLARKIFLVSL